MHSFIFVWKLEVLFNPINSVNVTLGHVPSDKLAHILQTQNICVLLLFLACLVGVIDLSLGFALHPSRNMISITGFVWSSPSSFPFYFTILFASKMGLWCSNRVANRPFVSAVSCGFLSYPVLCLFTLCRYR